MSKQPAFFVPGAEDGKDEQKLAEIAGKIGEAVPSEGKRIYSIEFKSKGETWTATVGEPLKGYKDELMSGDRILSAYSRRVSDPAIVLAILPNIPTVVLTDASPIGDARSQWNNPIRTGGVSNTVYFSN